MGQAVGEYYQSLETQDEREAGEEAEGDEPDAAAQSTASLLTTDGGGRRLGNEGDPTAPTASSSSAQPSSSRSKPSQPKKFGTLRDLQSDSHAGHGHGDDDEGSDKEQEFYAGGDKSGLAVKDPSNQNQNPSDQIRRLMNTARRYAHGWSNFSKPSGQ